MKVLVTGSSGRLGPYLVRDLEQSGHSVVLFSRREPEGEMAGREWVQGDIADPEACGRAMAGVEAVQHAAANPGPSDHPSTRARNEEKGVAFDDTMKSNIMGTYYLLQAAVSQGVKIFVMTGSNCALGHGMRISGTPFPIRYLPMDESHPCDVEDSYSYTKLAGEELLASYTRAYGIRTYAVRSAGICNEERRRATAENAKPATGWNEWLWAWVGSEDVASAQRMLMEKAQEIEPHGAYFCNGDETTALEPTKELVERFRPELVEQIGDLEGHASLLSNKRLRGIGWEPKTSWRT